jgi:hypothetical protein
MSDVAMDTPADSQTGGNTIRGNKPDTYHGDRKKLDAWILQVDRYFHLNDKIEEADKVVWATTFFRGDAEKWANPILKRYMDDAIEDQTNKELVEDWDLFKLHMKEIFSPFKESVIAEQKIQQLKQTRSAADYTTEFQQYKTIIDWDNNALMRMYRQGLKPTVRRELMRSGSNLETLDELMREAIRVDNELYELMLEERLFSQGTRAPGNTNDRPRHQPRRSHPNQGRQRSYTPRIPGAYATNGYEPMHLDNLNKGPGKPKFQGNKGNKKKITCYACGKEGHMKRDCRSQGKVVRQLNVLRRAAPNSDSDDEWNVVTRATVSVPGQTNEIVNGIDDLTIITKEEPTSDEYVSESESYEDLEVTEIDQTKYGKMANFQDSNRAPTPYAPKEQQKTLASQINKLLQYLNKPPIEYASETPDVIAAMRQDFYNLSQQVEPFREDLPSNIKKFLPTTEELDWINRAVNIWEKPKTTTIQCPPNLDQKINVLLGQLGRTERPVETDEDDFYTQFEKYSEFLELEKEVRTQGMTPEANLVEGNTPEGNKALQEWVKETMHSIDEDLHEEFVQQWNKDAQASWEEPTHQLSDIEKQEIEKELKQQCEPCDTQLNQEDYRFWREDQRREEAIQALRDFRKSDQRKQAQEEWLAEHQSSRAKLQQRNDERWQRNQDTHYWMDHRNPEHVKLSWTACLHDSCAIHYSDKNGANYYPRKFVGMPKCVFKWFDCAKDSCAIHLWDKRHSPYFYGHDDPQETLQMHITQQKEQEDGTMAWECNQPTWHTCLNIECDKHLVAKRFYGYGNTSFLDGRPIHLEPPRRSTA